MTLDHLPDNFSRSAIAAIEDVFGIGPGRLPLPYEYARTLEQHQALGRGEARPGRRKTSSRRHKIVAMRVPRVRLASPEHSYVYRGTLVGETSSPEFMPTPKPPEQRTTTPQRRRPAGPDGTAQITHCRETKGGNWLGPNVLVADWYEVRPSIRSGVWFRVETDAHPETGKVTYATCSCSPRPPSAVNLCDHAKQVLRLIRDGVKIGRCYS